MTKWISCKIRSRICSRLTIGRTSWTTTCSPSWVKIPTTSSTIGPWRAAKTSYSMSQSWRPTDSLTCKEATLLQIVKDPLLTRKKPLCMWTRRYFKWSRTVPKLRISPTAKGRKPRIWRAWQTTWAGTLTPCTI